MDIFNSEKETIDTTYVEIQDRVFKLREREKDLVTDRLKSMTDEQRDIIVHFHKPGRSFYYDVDKFGVKTFIENASKDDVKKKIEEIQGMFSNVV